MRDRINLREKRENEKRERKRRKRKERKMFGIKERIERKTS